MRFKRAALLDSVLTGVVDKESSEAYVNGDGSLVLTPLTASNADEPETIRPSGRGFVRVAERNRKRLISLK
jgi:hypothetical protein